MSRRDNPIEADPSGRLYMGSAIRDLRQKGGWRLEEMARQIAYHPGSLSKVENNAARPSDRMLLSIAEFLDVDVEELRVAPLHPRALKENAAEPSEVGAEFEATAPTFLNPPPPAMPSPTSFLQGASRSFNPAAGADVPAFLRRPSILQRFRHKPSDAEDGGEATPFDMRGVNERRPAYHPSRDAEREAEVEAMLDRAQSRLEEALSELELLQSRREELSQQEAAARARVGEALAELELARKLLRD